MSCISSDTPAVLPCTAVMIGTVSASGSLDFQLTSNAGEAVVQITLQLTSSLTGGTLTPVEHTFTVRVFRTYTNLRTMSCTPCASDNSSHLVDACCDVQRSS